MAFKMLQNGLQNGLQRVSQLLPTPRPIESHYSDYTSNLTLSALPDEVLIDILERVPNAWLVTTVSKVSRRLRRLARHPSLWIRVDLSNTTG